MHYVAPGAKSTAGNVTYWNDTLSLLWNPNLEHSRLGSYWSCYDAETNAFAAEGLRVLGIAAGKMNLTTDAAFWKDRRGQILDGLETSLKFRDPTLTDGADMYAELRGHPNDFHQDVGEVGYSPLLWGLSYVNIVPQVMGLASMSGRESYAPLKMQALGLNTTRLAKTWHNVAFARAHAAFTFHGTEGVGATVAQG